MIFLLQSLRRAIDRTRSRLVMRRGKEETGSIEVSTRRGDGENAAGAATYSLRHFEKQRDEAIQSIETGSLRYRSR